MTLIITDIDDPEKELNVEPLVAFQGFSWQREDIDGPGAGRTLDGKLRRERIATKRRLDIVCKPLTLEQCSAVLTAIMPEWVMVTYTDPQSGIDETLKMYSNNNPAKFLIKRRNDADDLWGGITFPLIEE